MWVCTYACRILDLRTDLKTSRYTLRVFLNSDSIKLIIPLLCYRHGGGKKKIINNKQICATFLYDCSFTGHETLYTILYRNSGLARIDSFKVWQTLLLAEGMDHIIFDKIIIDRDDNNKDILFSALQRVCIFLFRSIYSRINDPRQIRNISSRYILSHISKFICSLISVGNRYMNK